MFLFHLIVKHLAAPPVWAISSSEGIQESAVACGVGINGSGRKSLEVSRAVWHTDIIVCYLGVR